MPTEKDYKIIEKATIYDLRLLFSSGEKETYTKEEVKKLIKVYIQTADQK